jgi:hypothetical protein
MFGAPALETALTSLTFPNATAAFAFSVFIFFENPAALDGTHLRDEAARKT